MGLCFCDFTIWNPKTNPKWFALLLSNIKRLF